jgi:uncharacterized protein (TIGR02453 family)
MPAARCATEFTGFRPGALTFFRQLRRNNTRAWFEEHRAAYEGVVRGPLRALVEEMDIRFARFAPEIVGDPRRSVFRIHRDVRFSADKSPYKTHGSCWFYHRDAGRQVGQEANAGSAGFYVQIAPGDSFLGAGIWMPPRGSLNRIREALAEDPGSFGRVAQSAAVRRRFGGLDEEAMLKRMPRGFAEAHPAARWLRYQSFTLGRALTDAEVLSPRLAASLERDFTRLTPVVRWLNAALGYPPAASRQP